MPEILPYIPALPLAGFIIIGLFGKYLKNEKITGWFGSLTVGASFVLCCCIFFSIMGSSTEEPHVIPVYTWIQAGYFSINISYQADRLSILFGLIVTGVGFLIHVYSIGYMHGDRSFYRFFAYLNLFIFMMLNLVLSSNFLLTFLGWEGVGLCSYLLIGFWYDREFEGVRIKWTGDAANKAFIVNRIGDFGFIIAMFLLLMNFGTLEYSGVESSALAAWHSYYGGGMITAITLLLFLGCTGKSAQIPLAVWLPDAMAGPTPVSALIHAATMVTAGIFLIARNAALFALSPSTMQVVAIIGTVTAFFAATIGLVQNDIKKVLAYSTVSQLGFMFAALGAGAFTAGVFHVLTHAFFKGLLFLGAGAVIHGLHDEQNIKFMGGLKRFMPKTHLTFLTATLAISGIPLFSGFFSKDEILWNVFSSGNYFLWLILASAAFCTAFYMFRLVYLVFYGENRFDTHKIHPHEAPSTMTIPLIILAALSALGGFIGIPESLGGWLGSESNLLHSWLHPVFKDAENIISSGQLHTHHSLAGEYLLMLLSIAIAVWGILTARKIYGDSTLTTARKAAAAANPLYKLLYDKYRLDEAYFIILVEPLLFISTKFLWKIFDTRLIDGIVNGSAKITLSAGEHIRKVQTGMAQNYAMMMLCGIIAILAWIVFTL